MEREGGVSVARAILKRLGLLVPVLLVVGTIVFLLVHMTPGDPAGYMLGPDASPADVERLRVALGLDRPLLVQYGQWLWHMARGDLGRSIFLQMPVTNAIAERLEPTLLLTVLGSALALVMGVAAGVVAAFRRSSWVDQAIMSLATLGVSIPGFWLGLNLVLVVGVSLRWLPVGGYARLAEQGVAALRFLILPAFAIGVTEAALIARMTRSSMLEVLRLDYIRTARSKGLTERVILFRHAMRNAALPIITAFGNSVAVLLGGAVVTETVFNIPGLGRLVIQSVLRRDYPVIQGVVLFVAGVYVLLNLVVDVVYMRFDPRIRYA